MSNVDWSKSVSIAWDEKLRENSVVTVPGTKVPAGTRERKRAEAQLGGLLFDVEGQGALAAYLRERYGERLGVSARKGGAPRLLRLAP